MIVAEPARPAAPPNATPAYSSPISNESGESSILPAAEAAPPNVAPAPNVEAAELYNDARKYAPVNLLDEPHVKGSTSILPETLIATGAHFAAEAAVSRGREASTIRTLLPCLFEPRDFVSYGEVARFVVLKDYTVFIYGDESDNNPLYTISLETLTVKKENPKKLHKFSVTISPSINTNLAEEAYETVLLLDSKKKLECQFTFDVAKDKEMANNFILATQAMREISTSVGKRKGQMKK